MKKRNILASGVLAAAAIGGTAALAVPAVADQVTTAKDTNQSTTQGAEAARRDPMARSLDTLVENGTITRAQADKVLAQAAKDRPQRGGPDGSGHGPGGPGHRGGERVLQAAAQTLGLTADDLRQKLSTQTLGEIADARKVSRDTLASALEKAMTSDAADRARAMLDEKPGDRPGADGPGRSEGAQRGDRQDGARPGGPRGDNGAEAPRPGTSQGGDGQDGSRPDGTQGGQEQSSGGNGGASGTATPAPSASAT